MSTIGFRLPESLHKAAGILAREENISINQLIALALAETSSTSAAEAYREVTCILIFMRHCLTHSTLHSRLLHNL
jgi:HicB family